MSLIIPINSMFNPYLSVPSMPAITIIKNKEHIMDFFHNGSIVNDYIKNCDLRKGIVTDTGGNIWRIQKENGGFQITEHLISDEVRFFYNNDIVASENIENYDLLEGSISGVNGGVWGLNLRENGTLCYDIVVNEQIVILANSWKPGGTCIAGREVSFIDNQPHFGNWIRPVSCQGAISPSDSRLDDGNQPRLLDIIQAPVIKNCPGAGQPENYLIDPERRWRKVSAINLQQLSYLSEHPGTLWGSGDSVAHSTVTWNPPSQSLYFVKPDSLYLTIYFRYGKKVRAEFRYNGRCYGLQVTDPLMHNKYTQGIFLSKGEEKRIHLPNEDNYYLCISLAEEWRDKHYKVVAAIIKAC